MGIGHISLTQNFGNIRFSRATLQAFIEEAKRLAGPETEDGHTYLTVQRDSQEWQLPTVEQFLTEIGYGYSEFTASVRWGDAGSVRLAYSSNFLAEVAYPHRHKVEEFTQFVLDRCDQGKRIQLARKPLQVFIGHGRSEAWKDLKNHLTDIHHIKVDAYEVASRGGFTIREVLDSMLKSSTLALLVMTAEDTQDDGSMRARQNVVHEAGLFQGRLGFQRALILKERGVELMSNVDGVQFIEFAPGNIREAFGDVLGVIKREFPER
ncbi:hypothetical protein A20C1_04726 [marine actinobacterium PHSC20C1]|nr:hypothetical protein A20C1_04726 [marine actinobacterium PHSC20C1]